MRSAPRPAARGDLTTRLARGWGWVLADGIIGVVVGALALALPGITVVALAVLVGVGLLFQGIAQAVAASRAAPGTPGRGWAVALAVLALVAGVICVLAPGVGIFTIIIGVTLWFFVAGINEIIAGITLPEGRVLNIIVGIITLLAAIVLLFSPGVALGTAAVLAGVLFLVRGIAEIVLAVRLHGLRRR